MRARLKKVLAAVIAVSAALIQVNFAVAEGDTAMSPPEEVVYLYNHDCEDLTLGETVGVGPYLSSAYSAMNRVVATPDGDTSNGKSIKVTSAAGSEQFYKIFTGVNTYYDGLETENPTDYNNEIVVSFDVYREDGMRTPNFTIMNNEMNNMTLASAFIDKNGKLSVATSNEIKSMPHETATDKGYFVYDTVLEADMWHHITIVYNKDEEKTTWFADNNYVCDAVFPTKNATYQEKKGRIYTMRCFALVNEQLASSAYIDNIKIAHAKSGNPMQIQTELYYYGDEPRGVTVTGPGSAASTFDLSSISNITKDYLVEFNIKADTITAKGACITLLNANSNALATAFMANTAGSLVVRTESTATAAIGADAATISGYTERDQATLKNAKLFHMRNVFEKDVYTNFKLYVDIAEKAVYYYVNDVYVGKTASTDYSLIPAKVVFTYPTNNGASTGGKFWVQGMRVGYTEPSAVSVTGLDIVGIEGDSLNGADVFADDEVGAYVKAAVTNETASDAKLLIVIAQYNGDRMIDTKIVSKTVASGADFVIDQSTDETCSLTISADTTVIKAFVWDETLLSYCDCVEAVPNIE
jgi:hypothetical protein